ncbi:L7Ae/L30e/S12e/Gadd45 family ribosomal protein [Dolosicoccus paucivorans]|uniref:50S ribosomal protein L7ae n=1 Tax=Dolosicoccus paucivorans TaxID=84521 RepID=A0A1G8PG31_9LACT|nr:ribosomal L7Ae/L30e/S12e/Gadd45 family protein [Dolosicoccus paucivorans]PMB83621.1 50S ribosomal protein L7ae [Dolosicoccus paucivorans]PMC59117.1 50S ribosomal protein L7ae [Dolosicoccus paucivorans]SDI91521.1 Ribosomal protein L7Ae [Dolosicoccus paucivorans]
MLKQKQLNLLGLGLRSRNLITGTELVEKGIKSGEVVLIICAKNASKNTIENLTYLANQQQVPLDLTLTTEEITEALGRPRTVCGFSNRGMAKRYLSYLDESKGELK